MSLDRRQISFIAAGVVFAVVFAVLAVLLAGAISARGEAVVARDDARDTIRRFYAAKIFPSAASLAAVKTNAAAFTAWCEAARTLAGRGDRRYPSESPAAFKQRLQAEVRRMVALPGGVAGRLAAPAFLFGFDKYLGENVALPAAADIPKLQSELDLIAHVADLLAAARVLEVRVVRRDESPVAPPPAARRSAARNGRDDSALTMTKLSYVFEFLGGPAAVVQVLNGLASDQRFIVITDFSLASTADLVMDKLNARDAAAKAAQAAKGSTSRRRRRGTEPETPASGEEKKDSRLVIDPEIDAPLKVTLALDVYDFGLAPAKTESPAPVESEPAIPAPAPAAVPAPAAAVETPAAAPAPAAPAVASPAFPEARK